MRLGVAIQMEAEKHPSDLGDADLDIAIAAQVRKATGNFDQAEIERLKLLSAV